MKPNQTNSSLGNCRAQKQSTTNGKSGVAKVTQKTKKKKKKKKRYKKKKGGKNTSRGEKISD
jgi:hypothetical protein